MRYIGSRCGESQPGPHVEAGPGIIVSLRSGSPKRAAVVSVLLLAVMLCSPACGERQNSPRYDAEKSLFNARKTKEKLLDGTVTAEFVDQVASSYRQIVSDHKDTMAEEEGLEEIVVAAQIELAELEFRVQRLTEARDDFLAAAELASGIPEARANAIYSAAVISELMEDTDRSIELYGRFHREFLGRESLESTVAMNTRYLVTPLKLAELERSAGNEAQVSRWLEEAKNTYGYVIATAADSAVVKEMRFNILTAHLQGGRWREALETIGELQGLYRGPADMSSLKYLEAKIHRDGLNDPSKALLILESIQREFPDSREASIALLEAGNIEVGLGMMESAAGLYRKIIELFPDRGAEVIEAEWQLARLAEAQGNWVDASLKYKSIYTKYPGTLQGLEAPLRIAGNYREKGETDAARAAYQQAIEHFEAVIASQTPVSSKILAEKHLVRAYTEQGLWQKAAERLLDLPDIYPNHYRFKENYLMAASIYERELGNDGRAAEILRICIERYPGTELAAEAERQIERIGDK